MDVFGLPGLACDVRSTLVVTSVRRFRLAQPRIVAVALASAVTLSLSSIADAQESTESTADLVAAVSRAQAGVDEARLNIGAIQESVNQALVDLRDKQARAEQARRGVEAAEQRLADAEAEVKRARAELDDITRSQYRSADQSAPLQHLGGTNGQKDALERARFLRQRSDEKQAALEAVERARVEAANEASLAREAADLADAAASEAHGAQVDAQQLLQDSTAALEARAAELDQAQADLVAAQDSLAEVRPESASNAETESAGDYIQDDNQDNNQSAAEQAAELAAEDVDAELVQAVEARVAELAPDAPGPSPEEIAAAVATAQTVGNESQEDTVEQASGIAAASALVGQSQAPHATFADPYAAPAFGSLSSSTSASGYSAGEIISAFAEGFQTGVGVTGTNDAPTDTLISTLPKVITPETVTENIRETVAPANSSGVETAIARAMSMVGTPYVWGGGDANGPTTGLNGGSVKGFDCSGLVLYAYAGAGVSLPHYTGYQYQRGTQIDPASAQRGDLLFWGPGGSQHVAIYLGDGMMIEAPQSGQNVSVVPVRWANMSPKAVRLL